MEQKTRAPTTLRSREGGQPDGRRRIVGVELVRLAGGARVALTVLAALMGGCSCNAPSRGAAPASTDAAAKVAATHPADLVIGELAAGFEREDGNAVQERVSDGWSGSRFRANWAHETWRAAATSLRGAKLKSASEAQRIYTLVDNGKEKEVSMQLMNDGWRLDYDTFKGPFPHE